MDAFRRFERALQKLTADADVRDRLHATAGTIELILKSTKTPDEKAEELSALLEGVIAGAE